MRGKVDRLAGHLTTVVVKETDVDEYKAVEGTVMEVMPGVPLNLTMHSVIVDRRYYTVQKEEVLAEYEEQLESFLLPPEKKVAIEKRIREKGKARKVSKKKFLQMLQKAICRPLPSRCIRWLLEPPIFNPALI